MKNPFKNIIPSGRFSSSPNRANPPSMAPHSKVSGEPFYGIVICETGTGMFNYHLRKLTAGGPLESGYAVNTHSFCGRQVGWDTKIPLRAWGKKDHLRSSWCKDCQTEALKLQTLVEVERVDGRMECDCGKSYREHPEAMLIVQHGTVQPWLTRLCDGRVVKL